MTLILLKIIDESLEYNIQYTEICISNPHCKIVYIHIVHTFIKLKYKFSSNKFMS